MVSYLEAKAQAYGHLSAVQSFLSGKPGTSNVNVSCVNDGCEWEETVEDVPSRPDPTDILAEAEFEDKVIAIVRGALRSGRLL